MNVELEEKILNIIRAGDDITTKEIKGKLDSFDSKDVQHSVLHLRWNGRIHHYWCQKKRGYAWRVI